MADKKVSKYRTPEAQFNAYTKELAETILDYGKDKESAKAKARVRSRANMMIEFLDANPQFREGIDAQTIAIMEEFRAKKRDTEAMPRFEPNKDNKRHAMWMIARAIPTTAKGDSEENWTGGKIGGDVLKQSQVINRFALIFAPPEGHTKRPGTYWYQTDDHPSVTSLRAAIIEFRSKAPKENIPAAKKDEVQLTEVQWQQRLGDKFYETVLNLSWPKTGTTSSTRKGATVSKAILDLEI
jgi:hypothetical protein